MSCKACGCKKDETAAAKERARIRRLIGPAASLRAHVKEHSSLCECAPLLREIDAITRPETKRKVTK